MTTDTLHIDCVDFYFQMFYKTGFVMWENKFEKLSKERLTWCHLLYYFFI